MDSYKYPYRLLTLLSIIYQQITTTVNVIQFKIPFKYFYKKQSLKNILNLESLDTTKQICF